MLEFLTSAIKQDKEKKKKRHIVWKEKSKTTFIQNDMTVYVVNSNESERKQWILVMLQSTKSIKKSIVFYIVP